jgi:hypothetical protein
MSSRNEQKMKRFLTLSIEKQCANLRTPHLATKSSYLESNTFFPLFYTCLIKSFCDRFYSLVKYFLPDISESNFVK